MIENRTEYTLEKYKQLERKEHQRTYLMVFSISFIIMMTLIVASIFASDNKVFYIIFGVIMFVLCSLYILVSYYRKPKIKQVTTRNYVFTDHDFEVTSSNKGNKSNTKYNYDKIMKFRMDRNNIYIYLTKSSALIVSNDGFADGGKIELIDLLKRKVKSNECSTN